MREKKEEKRGWVGTAARLWRRGCGSGGTEGFLFLAVRGGSCCGRQVSTLKIGGLRLCQEHFPVALPPTAAPSPIEPVRLLQPLYSTAPLLICTQP